VIDPETLGYNYAHVDDAVHGLLGEAVRVLAPLDQPYVVIGGWSPVLLAKGAVRHPGTLDVDVLFNGGEARLELESAFRSFLERGYLPSAKHPFQVIRVLQVSGRPMAFNIDLLHPSASDDDVPLDDLFVDQLDLGIPVDEFLKATYFMKSIVTPDIRFVFDDERWDLADFECTLPDGTDGSGSVRVIDELGLIVSKAKTVANPKRQRDAFDIALSVAQARDRDTLRQNARDLEKNRTGTFSLLGHIWDAVHNDLLSPTFNERVQRSIPDRDAAIAGRLVSSVIQFLTDLDLQPQHRG
jgi:hypothetical protein